MNYQIILGLIKSSQLLKQSYSKEFSLLEQCQKYGVLNYLNFKFIPHKPQKYGIGIRNIYCKDDLRISVYYIPKNQVMKLHDHQGMKIFSYMMQGQIQLKTYTLLDANIYIRHTKNLKKGDYSTIQDSTTNLHQMKALQNSLFLDIIFPDYNAQNDCHFFEEETNLGSQRFKLKRIYNYDILLHDI